MRGLALSDPVPSGRRLSTCRVISARMSSLETHLKKAQAFRDAAAKIDEPAMLVETWFLSAYHFIEACAARQRIHIQKHQRVPDELERNPAILGSDSGRIAKAFHYLEHEARAKFVYADSGSRADLERALGSFVLIESTCEAILR